MTSVLRQPLNQIADNIHLNLIKSGEKKMNESSDKIPPWISQL